MCHSRAKNDEINRLQEKDAYGLFRTTKYLLLNSCWKMLVMFLTVEIIKVAKGLKCYLFPLKDQNNYSWKTNPLLRYLEIRQCVMDSKASRI